MNLNELLTLRPNQVSPHQKQSSLAVAKRNNASFIRAGGPGSGRHPSEDPSHKHLYRVWHDAGNANYGSTNVSGNSRAHAERRFREVNPSAKGIHSEHIATRDSVGEWRIPTLKVTQEGLESLPVDQWLKLDAIGDIKNELERKRKR